MLRELPRKVSGIVGDLQDGRLSLSMRMFRNPDDRAYLTGLLRSSPWRWSPASCAGRGDAHRLR